jgi:O-antigen/teichoic acid export membrane protein
MPSRWERAKTLSASVRPKKTGLIVFLSRIVSVFTGLLFLVMMTRWLTPSQFGLWEFIIDVVAFAAYPTGIITYWATREVARGKPVARTALLTNQLTSVIGVGVYLLLALLSYREVGSALGPFLLSIALVPLAYWTQASASLVSGYDPAISGYSLFLSEPAKLILAYPLLFVFRLGIYGIIVSVAVSYLVQGLYTTYRLRPAAVDKFSLSLGLGWLKDWHVPTLVTASYLLGIADTFAASLGQGGTSLAGFYQAAFQVATIVSYATYLSVALYPMMLRNATDKLPGEVLEFALLFAIPMAAGAIAIAPKILYLLKPDYVASSPALVVLSFAAVAGLVSVVMDQSLMGREKADLAQEDRTRRILGSDLFFVSAANVVFSGAYVVVVFVLGYVGTRGGIPDPQIALFWASAQLVTWTVLAGVKVLRLRTRIRFTVSRWVAAYAVCGLFMGVAVNLIGAQVLTSGLDAIDYGLRLGLLILFGTALYFGLVAALDAKVRGYIRAVLQSVS